MNTGVCGVDAIGNTGEGLPELLDHAGALRGRFARTVNDVEGKEQRALMALGYEVQYRIFAPDHGAQDDDAHINIPNAEAWIDRLHSEAQPGANLSIINEPGELTNPQLGAWLHRCTLKLRDVNRGLSIEHPLYRHGVFPAWGYGHPLQQTWIELDPYIWEWVADGHDLAAHEGYDGRYDTFAKAFPSVIGRQLWANQRYRPRAFIINEFASSWGANDGWETTLPNGERWQTEDETAEKWAEAAIWYAAHGFYMIPFTFRRWKNNFRYAHSKIIKDRLVHINRTYPVIQETVPVPATQYDMLEHIAPTNGQMYSLVGAGSNETCRTRVLASGYRYFDKSENFEELFADDRFVYRAFDISSFRNNEVYCLWTKLPDGTLRYGNPWLPRYMTEGQIFKRTAHVIHYDAQGNVTKAADVTTWIKLVKYHARRTFASGRTVEGVAELQYGFAPDVSDVREHYFYGWNLGLVGFEDGVLTTAIGQGTPTTIKPPTVIPWLNALRPAVPPIQGGTTVPDFIPFPSGGVRARLTTLPGAFINLRAQPNGADVGDLHLNDEGELHPDAPQGDWLAFKRDDGLQGWTSLQGGKVGFTLLMPPPTGKLVYTEAQIDAIRSHLDAIQGVLELGVPLSNGGGF